MIITNNFPLMVEDELVTTSDEVIFILTEKEMESLYMELKNTWISRDNPLAIRLLSELNEWCITNEK